MTLRNERRSAVRNLCDLETFCQPITTTGRDLWWMGRIRNISHIGFGLTCSRRFEVGTYLAVELQTPSHNFPRVIPSRVIHARTAPNTSDWLIGCEFVSKLTEEELASLLS
jgi:hypothetical protein